MIKQFSITYVLLLLISCSNESNKAVTTSTDTGVVAVPVPGQPNRVCYAYYGKDSLQMRLFFEGERVWGLLDINREGKDFNKGTVEGKLVGDTLFGEYIFTSEGMPSARPIVFLRKGDGFVEGYGEVFTENGKAAFTKPVRFLENNLLQRIECNSSK